MFNEKRNRYVKYIVIVIVIFNVVYMIVSGFIGKIEKTADKPDNSEYTSGGEEMIYAMKIAQRRKIQIGWLNIIVFAVLVLTLLYVKKKEREEFEEQKEEKPLYEEVTEE